MKGRGRMRQEERDREREREREKESGRQTTANLAHHGDFCHIDA